MKLNRTIFAGAVIAAASCAAPENDPAVSSDHHQHHGRQTVKPGASVTFAHELRNPVDPGGSGVLELTIDEGYGDGAMTLTAASDALNLAAASQSTTKSLADGSRQRWDIFFDAPAGGVHYIDVTATVTDENGVTTSRAYSAAVKVGDGAVLAKPDSPVVFDAEGEPVMIMQAEESIEE